eukprot:6708627-Prymnesium_polylepis.1
MLRSTVGIPFVLALKVSSKHLKWAITTHTVCEQGSVGLRMSRPMEFSPRACEQAIREHQYEHVRVEQPIGDELAQVTEG